ncbi:hypothetical protein [Mycobacteroides abscessus]|uniref:hypothetical protein n=1 Tax=Mycobacteroides abscessus TaxID=36809 RepID=UPI0012FFD2F6|nr:hypothetical protein [Mycobacteroides abscessus]
MGPVGAGSWALTVALNALDVIAGVVSTAFGLYLVMYTWWPRLPVLVSITAIRRRAIAVLILIGAPAVLRTLMGSSSGKAAEPALFVFTIGVVIFTAAAVCCQRRLKTRWAEELRTGSKSPSTDEN